MVKGIAGRVSREINGQDIQEKIQELDWERTYSVSTMILFFFSLSAAGWLWEVFLHIFISRSLINRGTMHGPWLPIYGVGGILVLIVLKHFSDNPKKVFAGAYLGSGILEYSTGWALERFLGVKYWDYSQSLFDINGRVCLEVLLLFAAGALVILYIAAPVMDDLYGRIPYTWKTALCTALLLLFAADLLYSFKNPNMGPGITEAVRMISGNRCL